MRKAVPLQESKLHKTTTCGAAFKHNGHFWENLLKALILGQEVKTNTEDRVQWFRQQIWHAGPACKS